MENVRDPAQPLQYLVVLEPACDAWLFEAAEVAGLSPADFGLPATLPAFSEVVKLMKPKKTRS